MKHIAIFSVIFASLIAGCASQSAGKAVTMTREGLADAALGPLEDFNIRRDGIPLVLAKIRNPYDVPETITCKQIESEIVELNKVLPPDWDAGPKPQKTESLSSMAASEASEQLLKAVASEATGLIPYRSWVRKLSGANGYEKKVKQAVEKGRHRRTFLKARGQGMGCADVAVPTLRANSRQQVVLYKGDQPEGVIVYDANALDPMTPSVSKDADKQHEAERLASSTVQTGAVSEEAITFSPEPDTGAIKREEKISSPTSEY
jgi:hypothetical protein